MGRIFRSFVDDGEDDKYCCNKCGCDVASASSVVWEGFMGAQKPAVLLRKVVNVHPFAEPRRERLSTGEYRIVDVSCRVCLTPLGWTYLNAAVQEQKYKEGASLLSQGCLQRISPGEEFTEGLANKGAEGDAAPAARPVPSSRSVGARVLARSSLNYNRAAAAAAATATNGSSHLPYTRFAFALEDDLADLPLLLRGGPPGA